MFQKKSHTTFNEAKQIALAQKDHRHFGPLYERYFEQLFRFIFKRLGGNEELAGDLVQQCFMKAMANITKYEDRGLPFSAWLYRIAQNEVNMFFRSEKKNYTVEITDKQIFTILEENGENTTKQEDLDQLIEIINNLDDVQTDLIELRFFQELSFKEIADIYQISEANAKMRIYRLLEKINTNWKRES
ncbi:RNA polymerase sigma factor [Fluviicola taffensis]|uniref:RNA polymerase, sigma-24 subunit, ECF subfamily n=1 Tax=Fluviicola taffensis (strain DSM 16823 / NCIMB 13979 / RW262) TaxID=755732 RepID=F2IAK3_FLUTR|nr:sigma-70 family RNA polymerase sigma factor [Fluviicola taffensis]AEA43139.1 RNA polymerase, sigma-24 subunit, ECF subfamily [Fluviicola taffensis DSM 16823]